MVACLSDTFNRANSTTSPGVATSGETWTLQLTNPSDGDDATVTPVASIIGILSNQAYGPANRHTSSPHSIPDYVNIATVDTGYANIDASVDIPLGFAPGGGAGITVRWQSETANWIAFAYRSLAGSGYYLFIRKQTGGGASYSDGLFFHFASDSATGTRILRVKTCGPRWQAWVDGVSAGSFTDSYLASETKHGISIYFSTTVRLDNLAICPALCGGWGRRRFGGPGF